METRERKQVKQLGEILQQQQEPFILEAYLSEKECLKRPRSGNCLSCSSGRSNSVNHLPKLLKALCKKFFNQADRNGAVSTERVGKASAEKLRDNPEAAEVNRFSSASSTTINNSCTESDAEDEQLPSGIQHARSVWSDMILNQTEEAASGKKDHTLVEKDNRRCNPVCAATEQSCLQDEATRKELNVPTYRIIQPKTISEDSLLSASILEILFKRTKDKPNFNKVAEPSGLIKPHISHEYLSSKRSLQQTTQLLFDCVREVIEHHGKREKIKQGEQLRLGGEDIGKLICEKIMAWGKTSGNENRIDEMLHPDFVDTKEEWENHVPQKMQISMGVGDAILEDMRNEVITEMTGFLKL